MQRQIVQLLNRRAIAKLINTTLTDSKDGTIMNWQQIELLGSGTNVKDAMNAIEFNNVPPVIEYHGYLFVIDYTARSRGQLYYTKFTGDATEALYTVHLPYSNAYNLGQLLDRGEGLGDRLDPAITTYPALGLALLN